MTKRWKGSSMYLFQVFLNRPLTPSQGQQFLEEMTREIDKNPQHWTPHSVKIPGVTRYDNVFPKWLSAELEKLKLSYDRVNLCYAIQFKTEQEAVNLMDWFDREWRPWAGKQYPQGQSELSRVQVRVMDEHEDVANAQSF